MILCKTIAELRQLITKFKQDGKSIGLVPTMGHFTKVMPL